MNHDAAFKAVRNTVIEYLLGPGKRRPQPGPSSPTPVRDVSAETIATTAGATTPVAASPAPGAPGAAPAHIGAEDHGSTVPTAPSTEAEVAA
jgi:hypothetical protein